MRAGKKGPSCRPRRQSERGDRIAPRTYMNRETGELYWNGHLQEFTRLHTAILVLLIDHPMCFYSVQDIATVVWGRQAVSAETVRRHLRQLTSLPSLGAAITHVHGRWAWTADGTRTTH
jgi:DNA-binding response OmpR family regulator